MIYINDKEFALGQTKSVADVLKTNSLEAGKGVAIALNNKIIPRTEWESCTVKSNDRLIMIRATQGG
jgi:sulfur carrier protein